ncbi:MAG: creatininase family protein [Pseudolabrys sp.]|jgi:creatinine amidohydrolase
MRLELMTSPAVEAYLGKNSGIVVPVGTTEQHGPDGLIGTDFLCPETIARRFGEQSGTLIAPTMAYGMSQFQLGFAGSMSLRPSTLAAMAHDIVASLAATGFARIYFLNGHGGNLAPLRAGIHEYYATRSFAGIKEPAAVHCRVKSWWEFPEADALRKALYGNGEGSHATPSEVAVTMAAYPDTIKPFVRPAPPPVDDTIIHAGDNYFDAADFRRRYADGRVGSDSALATPDAGRRIVAAAVAGLAEDFESFCQSK